MEKVLGRFSVGVDELFTVSDSKEKTWRLRKGAQIAS